MEDMSASFANLPLLEELYAKWLKDPSSVDPSWRYFFEGMELGSQMEMGPRQQSPDLRVSNLINAYRTYGHLMAKINPLVSEPPPLPPELRLENVGFNEGDLNLEF